MLQTLQPRHGHPLPASQRRELGNAGPAGRLPNRAEPLEFHPSYKQVKNLRREPSLAPDHHVQPPGAAASRPGANIPGGDARPAPSPRPSWRDHSSRRSIPASQRTGEAVRVRIAPRPFVYWLRSPAELRLRAVVWILEAPPAPLQASWEIQPRPWGAARCCIVGKLPFFPECLSGRENLSSVTCPGPLPALRERKAC